MGYIYFFTGFPGFIANQLIMGLIKKYEVEEIYVLTLPQQKEKGEEWKENITKQYDYPHDKFHLVLGDITKEKLAIPEQLQLKLMNTVTHVFHLAAIYDLAVPKDIAYRVNVEGTRHVNEWVRTLVKLKRYIYFSTAYVAGKREGILLETELVRPTAFKNFYEETKYEAEVLVNQLKKDLPVTIIRPGIVKGHSETGATVKFDGPYFILNLIATLRFLPIFPRIGNGDALVNLVPIDYIVDAVLCLAHVEEGKGKTYHLTDPNPYTANAIQEMVLKEYLNKKPKGKLPLALADLFLSFTLVRKYLHVEKEVLDYFTWQGSFDNRQAQQDLAPYQITCPDLKEQIPAMVHFYQEHQHNKEYHIEIR